MALSAASAWTLAKEIIALFGGLCLVFNVLLPAATLVLQLAVYDAPEEFEHWRRHRAQQHELAQLTARIERLSRKRARIERKCEQHKSHSDDIKTSVRRRKRSTDSKRMQASEPEQAQASDTTEAPLHRHRLSIYSTVKKKKKKEAPPRHDHADTTCGVRWPSPSLS